MSHQILIGYRAAQLDNGAGNVAQVFIRQSKHVPTSRSARTASFLHIWVY